MVYMPKKKKQKSKPMQVWKLFKTDKDDTTASRNTCPKCGAGVYLARHKDRESCGRCGYTVFTVVQKPAKSK
jgi:small subunit ribosomal protein S27Ae